MIKDKRNLDFPCFIEKFDIEGIDDLAKMAMRYVATEDDRFRHLFKTKGKTVPDGTYSDFDCNVWEIMLKLVRYGTYLERIKNGDMEGTFPDTSYTDYLNLWFLGFLIDSRIDLRE